MELSTSIQSELTYGREFGGPILAHPQKFLKNGCCEIASGAIIIKTIKGKYVARNLSRPTKQHLEKGKASERQERNRKR